MKKEFTENSLSMIGHTVEESFNGIQDPYANSVHRQSTDWSLDYRLGIQIFSTQSKSIFFSRFGLFYHFSLSDDKPGTNTERQKVAYV